MEYFHRAKRPKLTKNTWQLTVTGNPKTNTGEAPQAEVSSIHEEDDESKQATSGAHNSGCIDGDITSAALASHLLEHSQEQSMPSQSRHGRLHERDTVKEVRAAAEPEAIATASIVDVIIDAGSSAIAQLTIPNVPTTLSLPNVGPFTFAGIPTSQASSLQASPTSVPSPPTANAASSQATKTESAISASTEGSSVVPEVPVPAPNQSSLSLSIPGSSSQVVLSSPPSTPLPSGSPTSSLSLSSSSYFSSTSSPPSTITSNPTGSSTQISSQGTATSSLGAISGSVASGNFSTTTFTSTGVSTTFTGTNTLNLETFTSNSTQPVTSTQHSSINSRTTSLTATASTTFSSSIFDHSISSFSTSTLKSPSSTSQNSHITSSSPLTTTSASFSFASGTSSGALGGGGFGNPTATGASSASPSSTAGSGSGSSSNNAPSTPTVVGSVVGGLAGLAVLLVLALFLLRWRRRQLQNRQLAAPDAELGPSGAGPSGGNMTQRSSAIPLAAPGFWQRLRPHSGQTIATTETAPSERGFQNLGGRKIESVLTSGGDGFGNAPGPSNRGLSGKSFYRDSQGLYAGPDSTPSSLYVGPGSPPHSPSMPPAIPPRAGGHGAGPGGGDDEIAIMRPGPARTPIAQAGFAAPGRGLTPPPRSTPSPAPQRDGVGRSHPSFDASRGSRFTENVG